MLCCLVWTAQKWHAVSGRPPMCRVRTSILGSAYVALRHGRAEVRRSLQARTVALAVILTLAVAIVFSGVSITSVCASLLNQITQQSRNDYSNMVQQTQTSLDAADVSSTVQVQQLVNDLASSLQSIGSPHDSIVISDIKAS